MKKLILTILTVVFVLNGIQAQQRIFIVTSFDKIIISPHIEINLVEGTQESVVVENAKVSLSNINIEVEGSTLLIYLDGAKVVTKSERVSNDNWRGKKPLYNGTMATVNITYLKLKNLSIRGEEIVRCKGSLVADDFKISL
ncbi:GIN domain-containing protein [Maribacter sp. ACAM166]|uniref:GIN domain-containing protein n=1 Tax=Maribacter sp. ACAM166 TaxID=2508996 RepID=UPI0010FD8283|nr:DUF2807 domain-containing protein [Maribacter sp. ACAM166]TLP72930.1 hypothetical protein ES765_18360 [Maribacter sp. ACAM166]